MMSDPGPPALVWLPLLHRIANVENGIFVHKKIVFQKLTKVVLVVHPVQCDACQRENFTGFRYRCQKCPHYTLCQDCFWKGRISAPHALEHQVKEYSSFVRILPLKAAKQLIVQFFLHNSLQVGRLAIL